MTVQISFKHHWKTLDKLTDDEKGILLRWLMDNDFIKNVESLSMSFDDEENKRFMEVYQPMLHRIYRQLEVENKISNLEFRSNGEISYTVS